VAVISGKNDEMNIYLIGYRGTGKTSVGKFLAAHIGWDFIDMDDKLSNQFNTSIRSFVNRFGWDEFRERELDLIRKIGASTRKIVATGGGIILKDANVECMQNSGRVVWLNASAETIKARLSGDGLTVEMRPALTSEGTLTEVETVLRQRNPRYERGMDFSVNTDARPISEICQDIINALESTHPFIFSQQKY